MCATPWTEFFLNSNGDVTFGVGDTANIPTIPTLLSGPAKIAPMWADFDPSARAVLPINYPLQALGFAGPNAWSGRPLRDPSSRASTSATP